MPPTLSYPGVYIVEVPSGVRTIAGVATSITAFLGRAKRGPTDRPVKIQSFGDFERIFGGLWNESQLGFSVRDFYRNGGGTAIVCRLHNKGAAPTTLAALTLSGTDGKKGKVTVGTGDTETAFEAVAPGTWSSQVSVTVEHAPPPNSTDCTITIALAGGPTEKYNAINLGNMESSINGSSQLVRVTKGAKIPPATTVKMLSGGTDRPPNSNAIGLTAADEGAWGNDLFAKIDHTTLKTNTAADDLLFNLTIGLKDGPTEVFRNVSSDPTSARFVNNVLAQSSDLARGMFGSDVRPAAMTYFSFVGGSDGLELTSAQFNGPGLAGTKQGLYMLQDVDLFNILVIPPYEGAVDPDVVADAAKYCEDRRAFLVLDAPWTSKGSAVTGLTVGPDIGTSSKNAAAFFPLLKQANPLKDNQIEDYSAAGAVAGVMARTDATRGIWKAPAGQDAVLNGVPDLSVKLTDPEIGELNQLGLNCLKSMSGVGRVVWGARTLQGSDRLASEWKYIPVRRLTLYIEESLYRGTQWAVFEPNDEPLWGQLRLNVGAFMASLFRQGAFQGSTPKDAYFVKCDKDTTKPEHVNAGIVNIQVGFAPLKPAEFVVISIQQIAGQAGV